MNKKNIFITLIVSTIVFIVALHAFGVRWSGQMLPILSYMQAESIEDIARESAKQPDIREWFGDLGESALKMEIRRQFYLFTNGGFLDEIKDFSFTIDELDKAGMLEARLEDAKEDGNLDLSNLKIGDLYGLDNVLDRLEVILAGLDLSNNMLTVVSNYDFSNYLSRLQDLNLSYNQIEVLAQGCFYALESLVFLDLGHNKITNLVGVFDDLFRLEKLDISDNKIKFVEESYFAGLDNLREINLSDNEIEGFELEGVDIAL
jgi:hypothetical protein